MVEVRYFKDATRKDHEVYAVPRIADFLRGFSREDLIHMKFYRTDILGEEISTEDGTFIDIDNGMIVVIDGRSIPAGPAVPYLVYVAIAIIAAVVAVALTPKPEIPDSGNRKQQSATNSLGQASNEPRINERIDDIFGYVAKHMPPLWQVPYRVGVNNQETEVMLLCVGRGKYEIDSQKIYDGDTPYFRIPNSKVNVYEPGTHPGKGSPSITLGGVIDQEIGIYRESNDLNASELLPPNDLTLGSSANWTINESGGTALLTLTNAVALEIDLQDYFTVGSDVTLIDAAFAYVVGTGTTTLYRKELNNGVPVSITLPNGLQIAEISGDYEVTAVTANTITITGTSWGNFATTYALITNLYSVGDQNGVYLLTSTNSQLGLYEWYLTYDSENEPNFSDKAQISNITRYPDVGQLFSNIIGPITIPEGTTKLICNLTSASGFYKLVDNNEKSINASVVFVIEETDINGVATGNATQFLKSYNSNSSNTRYSVYQTYELDVPVGYEYSRVYARRLTNRDKNSNVSNVDKIEWTLLYTFEPVDVDNIDFGDVTLMHCVVPSNSQSRLIKNRRTNLDVTRKITQYLGNGLFGPTESYATDDFSQIMIHTALDPYCGRLTIDQINADGFLTLKQQIIDYFGDDIMTRFGYDFDDTQVAYDDMYTIIANVVNCIPYVQNGIYDAFFERRQDTSTMQITHRNKLPDSETCDDIFDIKYDGVELTYRDRDTSIDEVVYIPTDRSSTNPERLELPGCTTQLQAYRRALRLYNKQIYQVRNVQFDVDEFGRMIVPGQRIDSPDGTRFVYHAGNTDGYRIYDGEIVEVNGLIVELSEPVTFTDGEDHYIQFTNTDGDNSELILCTPGSSDFEVILSQLPADGLYDGYERDKTKFTFCSEQVRESIALIPQTIESKIDNGQEINTVSSVNYDARYYQGDLETL